MPSSSGECRWQREYPGTYGPSRDPLYYCPHHNHYYPDGPGLNPYGVKHTDCGCPDDCIKPPSSTLHGSHVVCPRRNGTGNVVRGELDRGRD